MVVRSVARQCFVGQRGRSGGEVGASQPEWGQGSHEGRSERGQLT